MLLLRCGLMIAAAFQESTTFGGFCCAVRRAQCSRRMSRLCCVLPLAARRYYFVHRAERVVAVFVPGAALSRRCGAWTAMAIS
jgi:hypothetical protein